MCLCLCLCLCLCETERGEQAQQSLKKKRGVRGAGEVWGRGRRGSGAEANHKGIEGKETTREEAGKRKKRETRQVKRREIKKTKRNLFRTKRMDG